MGNGKRHWTKKSAALILAAACMVLPAAPAWAGWQQDEKGMWSYLDDQTGEVRQPVLNQDSVCYLMENALKEAGLYQDELAPTVVRLIYEDEKTYKVGAGYRVDMDHYEYYNLFLVDKKTGEASSRSTKHRFQLLP